MRDAQPVSVVMVATVSAAVQGGMALIFVPILSFLFAVTGLSPTAAASNNVFESGMTIAVVAPALCAILGFVLGAFMAFMFNMFVSPESRRRVVAQERARVRSASVGSAA